ncbi:two-component system chemotaxis response regulator CheB [Catalinimonas alkaloidigena]|uniref:chemotaxis protein CheB n=1 Tax=Catalinimonas alkaloidigena TaxID=1075417 RepID=UPI002404AE56|nr:chemotaxis protein CheB [Catalinimonas alkaloidigena]MDF9797160.1 two-component system chemotaxis response regulator CheB [Catalinimonas alkaloidigena]
MTDDILVVGIGYSAGGIPPLKRLFENIPLGSGLSFVVVQHLQRRQRNRLKDILEPSTNLDLTYVEDSIIIQPDHIYLLKSNQYVKIWDNHLYLQDRREEEVVNYAIDTFFTSLAEERQHKAIGVILSGGGNDGTKGCVRIYEEGGKVLVQSPQSAEFQFLPANVIDADNPVAVEKREELAKILLEISQSLR